MRLLTLLPLAAMGLQAPIRRAPIQRRSTARAAFSFSEAADSLKLDEASSKAADAAAKASSSFLDSSSRLGAQTSDAVAASSKATFEAAQSALKVVDSDAVKNALKAGDGAADGKPDSWGMYAYDTAWLYARAIANVRASGASPHTPNPNPNPN